MMKRSEGYMTVEATVSLTIFLFLMMFVMNFGQIYSAQNYVNHNLYQAGKMVAYFSFDYDDRSLAEDIVSFMKVLLGETMLGKARSIEGSWVSTVLLDCDTIDYSRPVQIAFDEIDPNMSAMLQMFKIEEVCIDKAEVDGHDIDISATYRINLYFGFFGKDSIDMHQHVKCGLWARGE